MSKIIVAKFGGTSMADEAAILQSSQVGVAQAASAIVVSATSGTTNALHVLADALVWDREADARRAFNQIAQQHRDLAKHLAQADSARVIDAVLEELESIINDTPALTRRQLIDAIVSFGERLSAPLMVAALAKQGIDAVEVDARTYIKTDDHFRRAVPDIAAVKTAVQKTVMPLITAAKVVVTQGYIGSAPDGKTTTLGRGGSDYTATLLAEAMGADLVQIWTDVAGIASTDPRLTKQARPITELTFQEAAELATAGAKILYPKTIVASRRAKIPVFIGNTFAPEAGGTLVSDAVEHQPLVRAIAIKTDQTLLTITSPEMAHRFGYLAKIFQIFADFKVSIDQISTSEISVAVAVENQTLIDHNVLEHLEVLGDVKIKRGISIISLIGNRVNRSPGFAQAVFTHMQGSNDKIAVRMICQGASKHNFCFLIDDEHGKKVVTRLHKAFIEEGVMS